MTCTPHGHLRSGSRAPWLTAGLVGVVLPALAIGGLAGGASGPGLAGFVGPVVAVAMMSLGMIAGAASGRMLVGAALACAAGGGLLAMAHGLGVPLPADFLLAGLALLFTSISFAARGALFAKSAGTRGWWIAVSVVAGEAGVLFTAAAAPDALPRWLLALLPAQWASAAIGAFLAGAGAQAALWELAALIGTAGATMMVAALWPRRWPYIIMFGLWIAMSALVLHRPEIALT